MPKSWLATNFSFWYANTPGSTWIYQPIFNLRMLTSSFRYGRSGERNWKTAFKRTQRKTRMILIIQLLVIKWLIVWTRYNYWLFETNCFISKLSITVQGDLFNRVLLKYITLSARIEQILSVRKKWGTLFHAVLVNSKKPKKKNWTNQEACQNCRSLRSSCSPILRRKAHTWDYLWQSHAKVTKTNRSIRKSKLTEQEIQMFVDSAKESLYEESQRKM